MTVMESMAVFNDEFPSFKIKKSKFFSLRPKHVLTVSKMPHNVCVCRHHANMSFYLEEISRVFPNRNDLPKNGKELVEALTCDFENRTCTMNEVCENCSDEKREALLAYFKEEELIKPTVLREWKNCDGFLSVCEEQSTVKELVSKVNNQLHYFKKHVYVKRMQSLYFGKCKAEVANDEVVLQIDFAENYSLTSQDEIQSAHWGHRQVTLFTAVAWLHNDKRSFVIVSDDMDHGKFAVWTFLKALIMELKAEFTNLVKIKIFSDGSAAQFKNRFTLSNLLFFKDYFSMDVEWNFSASGHGKGAVDGVGGKTKHNVWTAVKSRQYFVNTPEQFHECAKKVMSAVRVIWVAACEIQINKTELERRWTGILPIPNVQSLHHFTPDGNKKLLVSQTSTSPGQLVTIFPSTSDETESCEIKTGNFVLVKLKSRKKSPVEKTYYAEVLEIINGEYKLNYMHPSGNSTWIWPQVKDISVEEASVIVCLVKPPTVTNNRGQFVFH